MLQSQHAVATPGQRRVVRRQDRGQSVGPVQPLHQIENRLCVALVQVSGGLIGQQHPRVTDQSPSDGYPLLLAAREFPRAVLRSRG